MAIACTISNERYSISIRQDRDILSYSANTYSVCRILSKNIYIYIERGVRRDKTRIRTGIDNSWKIRGLKCEGSREVMKLYSLSRFAGKFYRRMSRLLDTVAVHLWGILAEDVD